MKNKSSYTSSLGSKLTIEVLDYGVILHPDSDTIALTPDDMEKFAKTLFAIRRKNFPDSVLPKQASIGIHLPKASSPLSYMESQKLQHKMAYQPWSEQEEDRLRTLVKLGKTPSEIAESLDRNEGSIYSRMRKLGLLL